MHLSELIKSLELIQHPEGGWFKETSSDRPEQELSGGGQAKAASQHAPVA